MLLLCAAESLRTRWLVLLLIDPEGEMECIHEALIIHTQEHVRL
jgi:hypothetical protein